MASDTAKRVAHEVIKNVSKGKRVSKKKILLAHGYAPSVAKMPGKVMDTKSYKSVMDPFVDRMLAERDAIIARMPKVRSKAKYRDLTDGLDKLTKNIQLLTGGSTANVLVGVKKLSDDELTKLADE